MATLYTDIATKQNDPHSKNSLDGRTSTPNFKIMGPYVYTAATTDATGDTLNIVKFPAGTVINPLYSQVVNVGGELDDTSCTITVGANGDVDALSTALNVNAAGKDDFALNVPVTLTSEGWVTATFTRGGEAAEGATLAFYLAVNLP
jgi:hypothetical protein